MLKEDETVQCTHNVTFPQKQLMLQKCHVIKTTGNKRSIRVDFGNILAVWKYWNIMTEYGNVGSGFIHKSPLLGCWNLYATVVHFFLSERAFEKTIVYLNVCKYNLFNLKCSETCAILWTASRWRLSQDIFTFPICWGKYYVKISC